MPIWKRARKDLVVPEPNEKKFTVVENGSVVIRVKPTVVENPEEFDNIFKKGERVGKIQITSSEGFLKPANLDVLLAIKRFKSEYSKFTGKHQLAGFYGDTSNSVFLKHILNLYGNSVVLQPPLKNRYKAKMDYIKTVLKGKSPIKYVFSPVKRIVLKDL